MSNTKAWTNASGIPGELYSTVFAWLTQQYCDCVVPWKHPERFVVTLDRVGISQANCRALYALGGGVALRAYLDSLPNPYYLPEGVDHG